MLVAAIDGALLFQFDALVDVDLSHNKINVFEISLGKFIGQEVCFPACNNILTRGSFPFVNRG